MSKKILILGANSDVAKACVPLFASKNYIQILAGHRIDELEDLAKKYNNISTIFFDALSSQSHEEFYNQIDSKPDVVLVCFGFLGNNEIALNNLDMSQKIIDVNFTGAVSSLQPIIQDFSRRKKGVIIGITSVAGDRGRASNVVYGAAKAGFDTYLSGIRNYLSKFNVRVVTIRPGFINTKMIDGLTTPDMLTAQPKEVAKTISKAINNNRNIIYVKPIWRLIMMIIKLIPERIFKKLSI